MKLKDLVILSTEIATFCFGKDTFITMLQKVNNSLRIYLKKKDMTRK